MTIPEQAVKAAANYIAIGIDKGSTPQAIAENALTAAAPYMSGVNVSNDEVERVARAWASIDGKSSEFDRAKEDHEFDSTDGSYSGYMAEAKELIKRSGLFDTEPSASREQALEEAAKWLDDWSTQTMGQEISPEYAATAIRALKSQPASDGWQPIETAPKDGSEFLGYDMSTKTMHVTFVNSNGYFHDPDDHYYSEAPDFTPTHWRPIPPAPRTGGGE